MLITWQIILNSMRKYQPRCHVIQLSGIHQMAPNSCCWTYSFTETQFIAVTSYQNDKVWFLLSVYFFR